MNGPILTAKEAKALLVTATTPKDHLKLSLYFNQEASRLEADAKEHDTMIQAYRKWPNPRASKAPGGVGTIEHCEFFAKSARDMAKAYRLMAAAHEEMANEASGEQDDHAGAPRGKSEFWPPRRDKRG
jgi:hypothetical protein